MMNFMGRRIFLATQAMDMRRGMDRLSAWVHTTLKEDPYVGDVFVFLSKDRKRVKYLVWDVSGYWLAMKRLESGRFPRPLQSLTNNCGNDSDNSHNNNNPSTAVILSAAELALLLEGINVHHATYNQHFARSKKKKEG